MPCPFMTSVLVIDVTRKFRYLVDRASETNHQQVRLSKAHSTLNNTLQQSPTIICPRLTHFLLIWTTKVSASELEPQTTYLTYHLPEWLGRALSSLTGTP